MTAERFLIRTEGGPMDEEVRVANAHSGVPVWDWPLPAVLGYDRTGRYVKTAESDLEPQEPGSGVVRGATYRWEAADG